MSEHEEIRSLLALAAAGALDEEEELRVARHLSTCTACAAEAETWQALARGLRVLPTPQAPAHLAERIQFRVAGELTALEETRASESMVRMLVVASWAVLAATATLAGGWTGWVTGASVAYLSGGMVLLAVLAHRRKLERRIV